MEYYSALERNELLSHKNTYGGACKYVLTERSQSEKGYILYDSNTVFQKNQIYRDSKKISSCQELREGKD